MDGKWRELFSHDSFVSLNFAAYDLLIIMIGAIGWEKFLDLRNSVFLVDNANDSDSDDEGEDVEEDAELEHHTDSSKREEERTLPTKDNTEMQAGDDGKGGTVEDESADAKVTVEDESADAKVTVEDESRCEGHRGR